jgi:hypothetical protein
MQGRARGGRNDVERENADPNSVGAADKEAE